MTNNRALIAAFDEDHVVKLTGVSKSQLRYWDRTDFFVPSYSDTDRRGPFSRVYSFKDVVSLKVLNVLRNQFGVSLPHLREVSLRLGKLGDARWTAVKLYPVNKKVVWFEPNSKLPQEIASGQLVVPVVLSDFIAHTKSDVSKLSVRDKSTFGKVEKTRYVGHSAAMVAGTRIPVRAVKAFADAGYSSAEILVQYPDLTKADVRAALKYEKDRAAA